MNSRSDLVNDPLHSLNTTKYLVKDLSHSLKHRHHAADYGSNPMNEPPYSINDIHHSAKAYQHLLNDGYRSSNYCLHSLNGKKQFEEDFIARYEGFIEQGLD